MAGLAPGRALDLACGEGRNAVWLAERGWEVTGVDFSDVALVKAAELAASRGVEVDWVVADVLEYEPEPHAYDLVAVLYLQLPREAMLRAIRGAADAVAPGGTLARPRPRLGEHHGRSRRPEGPGGALHAGRSRPELEGLAVERAEAVERTVPLPGGEAVAIDAFVRARRPR